MFFNNQIIIQKIYDSPIQRQYISIDSLYIQRRKSSLKNGKFEHFQTLI